MACEEPSESTRAASALYVTEERCAWRLTQLGFTACREAKL